MATTIIFNDFEKRVKRRVNEANNSPVGELGSGTSGTATTTTTVTVQDLADEGIRLLCRRATPVFGRFVKAVTPVGTRDILLSDLSPDTGAVPSTPTGSVLWKPLPEGVYYNGVLLKYVANPGLYDRAFRSAASGTPVRWSLSSENQILLDPAPLLAQTLRVDGLMLPPPVLTGASVMTAYVPDDLVIAFLEPYVAGQLCVKNVDDPSMAARGEVMMGQADDVLRAQQAALPRDLAVWAYPAALSGRGG